MIAVEDQNLHKKLIFLNSIRIAILSALALVSVIILLFFNAPFSLLSIIISLSAAVAISILFFPLGKLLATRKLLYVQLTFDILMITLLVYLSGGIVSPFYFLYILPIIVASIFLSRRDTLIIATVSFISFGTLSDLLYLEIISFYPNFAVGNVSLGTFIYNLLMSFIAFSSVSFISSYYFERIKKTGQQLKNIQENLQDMILLNNSVMEKMENGFITSDAQGRIVSFNAKAATLLRLKKGGNIFDLLLAKDELPQIRKIWLSNNSYYFEKKLRGFSLGISISSIEKVSSFERLLVFLITDLSAIKEIENKLKEKEHLALIGEMAAGIAHEIRNPLTSISGSVQFLRQELTLEPECKNLMNIIVKESDRLSAFIEEFLNFSRQSPLEISEFDLAGMVDDVVAMIAHNLDTVRFIKKYNPGSMVHADLKKIKQLLWNLLNNAVKALQERGEIEINLFQDAKAVYLSIHDFGVGMDRNEVEKIFMPFYSKFAFGIGLGMNIVKRIVEEHGFKMEIKSEKNLGTEVVICFNRP
ncbi:MAG TPA: ATP-binding protein [Patescibacteria group bacterium]|nr:ATP-binding protein [Patescibacteria group bacterium]